MAHVTTRSIITGALVAVAACSTAPLKPLTLAEMPAIDAARVLADTKVLSGDDFEGRSPGSAGETKTIEYLTKQFQAAGAEPGNPDGSWTQKVPLVGLDPQNQSALVAKGKGAPLSFKPHDDVIAFSQRVTDKIDLK